METEVTNCHYVELLADSAGIRSKGPGTDIAVSV